MLHLRPAMDIEHSHEGGLAIGADIARIRALKREITQKTALSGKADYLSAFVKSLNLEYDFSHRNIGPDRCQRGRRLIRNEGIGVCRLADFLLLPCSCRF